jgi:ribonuclease HI
MSWQIYVDGASSGNPGNSGAGIVILNENGAEVFGERFFSENDK